MRARLRNKSNNGLHYKLMKAAPGRRAPRRPERGTQSRSNEARLADMRPTDPDDTHHSPPVAVAPSRVQGTLGRRTACLAATHVVSAIGPTRNSLKFSTTKDPVPVRRRRFQPDHICGHNNKTT